MEALFLVSIIIGLIFSFFINYLTDLLPYSFALSRPQCHADGCTHQFSWIDYILLKRCGSCGRRSLWRPLFVYLITISASLYLWINQPSFGIYLLNILVFSYLFTVGIIDFEHHLILLPLNIAGLLILGTAGIIAHGWLNTFLGGAAGAILMYLLFLFGKLFTSYKARKLGVPVNSLEDSLAFGDVILLSLLGLLLGWPGIWLGLLLGVLLSGVLSFVILLILSMQKKYRQQALSMFIPLGPGFIIAAITIVYTPDILNFLWL